MLISARIRLGAAVAIVMVPLDVFLYLQLAPSVNKLLQVPTFHFWIVSAATFLATVIALVVGVSAARVRNIQVTFLATAFGSLAVFFSLHGLATPGLILPATKVGAVAAELSVFFTAFWLFMSALPSDGLVVRALGRRQRAIVPVWTALAAAFVAAVMWRPNLVDYVPVDRSPVRAVAVALTVFFCSVAAFRYLKSYRYSRFPLQGAIFFSAGWLAVTQIIMASGQLWRISWWLYHVLMVLSTTLLLVGLVRQYSLGSSIALAVRGLFTSDPTERLKAGISPAVRALVGTLELRDVYTGGHSFRVALSAFRLGEACGLSPEKLRALAAGGIVHDLGKIQVPDSILNKPGKLDASERVEIEKHPVTGYDFCKQLGFMVDELDVVRSHHEKWDGSGYPDGLVGEEIPMLARILAVADVYDALTSARSYREPWTHEKAREAIIGWTGSHFDPHVVEVWARITSDGALVSSDAALPEAPPAPGRRVRRRARFGAGLPPAKQSPRERTGA